MNAPSKSSLISNGYRCSANTADELVSRCAATVRDSYLLAYVTAADITAAAEASEIGDAWRSLTFVALLQHTEFATRTGGERKRFDYGEHLERMRSAKADAGYALKKLEAVRTVTAKVDDVLEVYFTTQFYK